MNDLSQLRPDPTPQETFWQGEFGSEYVTRNQGQHLVESNRLFFQKSLKLAKGINSCLELGANIGLNLQALMSLDPSWRFQALEINQLAADQLAKLIGAENVFATSIVNFEVGRCWDLVLIKGVLIHLAPEQLDKVYERLYEASGKYLLFAEDCNSSAVCFAN